jgi:predicted transposase YdaD
MRKNEPFLLMDLQQDPLYLDGLTKGKAEGKAWAMHQLMIRQGLDIEQVAQAFGMTTDEVRGLFRKFGFQPG